MTVRLVCGVVLGGLACFLFTWRGILTAFSQDATHGPFIWLGLCAFIGGIVAVLTVPRWQTPWYKRDAEEFNILSELGSRGQASSGFGSNIVKKSVSIRTVGEDGQRHEYSSMEDVPPDVRAKIEALEREAMQERGDELSVTETSRTGNTIRSKTLKEKKVSVYKIVDASGVERIYHSLEEMPPEIRAAISDAEEKSGE